MHAENISYLSTFLLMAPIAILMILSMFGLDERLAGKARRCGRRRFCELDGSGDPLLLDPDGRPLSGTRSQRPNQDDSLPAGPRALPSPQ